MKQRPFSLVSSFKSFGYALRGLRLFFVGEYNAKLHLLAAVFAIALGFYFKISFHEWMAITFCIGFVIAMEIVNTAIERLADFASQETDDRIKVIKDLSAAAVLVSAITALTIGLIIFLPKLVDR